MRVTISQRELRNNSGSIMRRVEQGESFTVTRNGVPVADLLPHNASGASLPQRFVPVNEIGQGPSSLPDWGADRYRHDIAHLDKGLDDRDRDPWQRRG